MSDGAAEHVEGLCPMCGQPMSVYARRGTLALRPHKIVMHGDDGRVLRVACPERDGAAALAKKRAVWAGEAQKAEASRREARKAHELAAHEMQAAEMWRKLAAKVIAQHDARVGKLMGKAGVR